MQHKTFLQKFQQRFLKLWWEKISPKNNGMKFGLPQYPVWVNLSIGVITTSDGWSNDLLHVELRKTTNKACYWTARRDKVLENDRFAS